MKILVSVSLLYNSYNIYIATYVVCMYVANYVYIRILLSLLLLSLLPVRHWKAYTQGTKPIGSVYLKPRGIK